jgi:S1-C subfamily serine protease
MSIKAAQRFAAAAVLMTALAGTCLAQGAQQPSAGPARGRSVAYLGAFLGDVTEERLAELKLTEMRGAVVGRVVEDSPAARAGIKVGDVLLTFRGESIEGREHFYRLLVASAPGRMVTLGISRDGVKQTVHVALSERRGAAIDEVERLFAEPDEIRRAGEQMALEAQEARQKGDEKGAAELESRSATLLKQAEEGRAEIEKQLASGKTPSGSPTQSTYSLSANRHLLGVSVKPLTPQLAGYFGVTGGSGLLVTEVKSGGLIERAGIKAGDCITALNGEKLSSLQDLTRQIGLASRGSSGSEVTFSLVRDRAETILKTTLPAR